MLRPVLTVLVSIAVAWHREEAALEHTLKKPTRAGKWTLDADLPSAAMEAP